MSEKFSVVISYPSWSKCIETFKKYLYENTTNEFELVEMVDYNAVYRAFNEGVKKAKHELVICICDDMFVGKGWDEKYLEYADRETILTGYLIESGIIPVSLKNIEYNCGDTPQNFDFDKFSEYVNLIENQYPPIAYNKKGWYMPILFYKSRFIEYPNEIKFPHPNDVTLIDDILPKEGFRFAQVKSFVYHLQVASSRL